MFDNSKQVEKWFAVNGDNTLRLDYPLDESSIVFDVGAYKGAWGEKIHNKYGSTIHMFEPVGTLVEDLKINFLGNSKIHIYSFGLSGRTRDTYINLIGKNLDGSTVLENIHEENMGTERIILKDIVEFIKENSIARIDLLKLNVEGLEFEILKELLFSDVAKVVSNIQVQFHNFIEGSERKRNLIQAMLEVDFVQEYDYPFVWEGWRRNR